MAHPANACGRCGATSYKPIIERGSDGVMRAAGRYACTGCKLQFATVADWKAAGASAAMPVAG